MVFAADVNQQTIHGDTPCFSAAESGQDLCVRALIVLRADVMASDNFQQTPIHIASLNGHLNAVQALIDAGADSGLPDRDHDTPMSNAVANGHHSIVALLTSENQRCRALQNAIIALNVPEVWRLIRVEHVNMVHDGVDAPTSARSRERWLPRVLLVLAVPAGAVDDLAEATG